MTPTSPIPASPPRRPPFVVRVFTSPVTAGAVERRLRRTLGPTLAWSWIAGVVLLGALVALAGWTWWANRIPMLEPRHRPEALCLALARPPAFAPPMGVEPSAALIPGQLPASAPPDYAIQHVMGFRDEMIVQSRKQRVGDYDVATLWLRLPEAGGSTHWLVVGWMEGSDVALCSFRFADRGPTISTEERLWGQRLLNRILVPEYFRAGVIPPIRVRPEQRDRLPRFGPRPER